MADGQVLGYGCFLSVDTAGDSAYVDIAGIVDMDWSASRDSVDATNQDSSGMTREKRPGMIDNGTVSLNVHFFFDNATQRNVLRTLFERDVTVDQNLGKFKLTFFTSDGGNETAIFTGFPTGRDIALPLEDLQEADMEIEITSTIAWSS